MGDRQTSNVAHFSPVKKILQRLGSAAVRNLSGIDIPDAVSGFRAISREAALQINIVSSFSYTTEMLIQAGKKNFKVVSVMVETNDKTRDSRLFTSIPHFIERQLTTMLRIYTMYQPLRMFFYTGTLLLAVGLTPILRFLYYYFTGDGGGHIQSLILGGILAMIGFLTYPVGLVADLINFDRQLIEMTLERVRRLELSNSESIKASDRHDG